jgi:Domain of unknown function (DUF1736)
MYLSSFNLWLLICPSQLSHDWQMGSIPIILNIRDTRNILTFLTISAIICIVKKIYNDLEVRRSRKSFAVLWPVHGSANYLHSLCCFNDVNEKYMAGNKKGERKENQRQQHTQKHPTRREIICENC